MKTMLLASAAALALTGAAYAHPVQPPMFLKGAHSPLRVVPHNGSTTLYNQGAASASNAVASNNLTSGYCTTSGYCYSSLDDQGADDFVLPAGKHHITEVYAAGESYGYFGSGYQYPNSYNVTFYSKYKVKTGKKGTKVGLKTMLSCLGQPYTIASPIGDMVINVAGCAAATKFKGGKTYGITVQANDDYTGGGYQYWFWWSNFVQNGSPAVWENYGGAYNLCTTWNLLAGAAGSGACFTSGYMGPDFAFALYGN